MTRVVIYDHTDYFLDTFAVKEFVEDGGGKTLKSVCIIRVQVALWYPYFFQGMLKVYAIQQAQDALLFYRNSGII